MRSDEPWNINIHYDRRLADLARPGDRVLDVGCGDGFLSARLSDAGCDVVAIDADAGVLGRAEGRWTGRPIEWVRGDVLTYPFAPGEFDLVVSNATLHHLPDAECALRRFAELTRPGGAMGVVGFARSGVRDLPMTVVGWVGIFVTVRVRRKWEHSAPVVWPPVLTFGQVRQAAEETLPGSRFRRLWLGRYELTWRKPAEALDGR